MRVFHVESRTLVPRHIPLNHSIVTFEIASQMQILVIGAGELGMAVLRALASKRPSQAQAQAQAQGEHGGVEVTVLMRPATISAPKGPKKSDVETLRSLDIHILPGDIVHDSIAQLGTLFKAFDIVIGCTGFTSGGPIQVKLAQAVLSAGVPRYVPWQFGLDYDASGRGSACDHFDEQLDVRDMLRAQSSTEWIIVSTGMFTSFLFEPSFGVVDVDRGVVRALGRWSHELTLTTADDIGLLTAEIVLAEKPRLKNQVVYVAGDVVSYTRVAEIVEGVLGREMTKEEWSVPRLQQDLAEDPDNLIKKYRVVFAQSKGVAWNVETSFNGSKGVAVTKVQQWAEANLTRLR